MSRVDMATAAEFRHGDAHIYRHIAGEHLLVSLKRTNVDPLFALSATGAVLWDALDEWRTPAALVDGLLARFEVAPADAATDVNAFLRQLEEIGALERRERAS